MEDRTVCPPQHRSCSPQGPALPPPSPLRSCCTQGAGEPLGSLQSDIGKEAASSAAPGDSQGEEGFDPIPSAFFPPWHLCIY